MEIPFDKIEDEENNEIHGLFDALEEYERDLDLEWLIKYQQASKIGRFYLLLKKKYDRFRSFLRKPLPYIIIDIKLNIQNWIRHRKKKREENAEKKRLKNPHYAQYVALEENNPLLTFEKNELLEIFDLPNQNCFLEHNNQGWIVWYQNKHYYLPFSDQISYKQPTSVSILGKYKLLVKNIKGYLGVINSDTEDLCVQHLKGNEIFTQPIQFPDTITIKEYFIEPKTLEFYPIIIGIDFQNFISLLYNFDIESLINLENKE